MLESGRTGKGRGAFHQCPKEVGLVPENQLICCLLALIMIHTEDHFQVNFTLRGM